ncbi:bifunctional methylenetetrahydrofolate dehydrogenase/methenyltetrahydrofolate cyclohydrolase [Helicobacter sp. 16-1353]|uniref:bifunctional 5,10-methylenetetrahydrofolate dehydrogenase/5,10-methenyltetrahydrofolate cyclohydrolase n=1 Tax=Helicobacter sp. 16-1353 TaxID=2004996 RepID=UPI000DCC57F9|nr:tetrahydrofolate dehydrogenase/cyclohydrolase catalytic domain-containing protein [Helicobacter sp. 16-1353]RAX51813.1 bifunctional methylenetetrahydrofolate dehydrogenase/methenyltetrahydrofolate cyclohydrolase [Helicobacter sp. 16-1353]
MDNKILDGRALSKVIEERLTLEVNEIKSQGIFPKLCVVLVGDNPASQSYVKMKANACKRVGIESQLLHFGENTSQDELLATLDSLNSDKSVNGILVQLPLPSHIDTNLILEKIAVEKDVDGFHPYNVGQLLIGGDFAPDSLNACFAPATPLGVMLLLKHYNIDVRSKDVTIIGASNIVGKPLSSLMLNAGASVSICHILTKDLKAHTINADIICVGVGKVNLLTSDMIKNGAIIIDIGINKLPNGAIVGDVDYENVAKKCSFITPVPGGVGPMTISALLQNTIKSAKIQNQRL